MSGLKACEGNLPNINSLKWFSFIQQSIWISPVLLCCLTKFCQVTVALRVKKALADLFPSNGESGRTGKTFAFHSTWDTIGSSRSRYEQHINCVDTYCWAIWCHKRWRARGKNCSSRKISNLFPSQPLGMEEGLGPTLSSFSCFRWVTGKIQDSISGECGCRLG